MASLNKVMLIGGLVRDPSTTYTQSGVAITEITVGTTEKWKDKTTGESREKSEYSRVKFFGKQAETIGKYMSKGSQIYVEGKLQTSQYEKDGVTRYSTDIIAEKFQFLGGKKQGGQQQPQNSGGFSQSRNGQANQSGGFQQANNTGNFQQQNNNMQGQFQGPPDDDIPF